MRPTLAVYEFWYQPGPARGMFRKIARADASVLGRWNARELEGDPGTVGVGQTPSEAMSDLASKMPGQVLNIRLIGEVA